MNLSPDVWAIALLYLKDNKPKLGEPVYKRVHGAIRGRDVGLLASATKLVPDYQWDPERLVLRQLEAFFKKNSSFADGEACLAKARERFAQAEQQCSITNQRLERSFHGIHDVHIGEMKKTIAKVLGDFSSFRKDLGRLYKVSSGATATTSRRASPRHTRLRKEPICSARSFPWVQELYSQCIGWSPQRFQRQDFNRVEYVPKNFKTDRAIACEPMHNQCLQLAFDEWCKGRLKRKLEIDLLDQSSNQLAAFRGSLDGSIATVDLEMASDTLSTNCVALLFPDEWFNYLNDVRVRAYRDDDRFGIYAKFSSMGNGSTFPIETLVFAAACKAVGSTVYRVYGDDIAIETHLVPELISLLAYLGFGTNAEKTFVDGPFRESCGEDYLLGVRVTPYYVRGPIKTVCDVHHAVNGLLQVYGLGENLASYLHRLSHEFVQVRKFKDREIVIRPNFCPENEDTRSGIFCSEAWLQSKRYLRFDKDLQQVTYRAFIEVPKNVSYAHLKQARLMWHFDKANQKRSSKGVFDVEDIVKTSSGCDPVRLRLKKEWMRMGDHVPSRPRVVLDDTAYSPRELR